MDYEHAVYMSDVEAEMLLGLLAADSATEDGKELHAHWDYIIQQLNHLLND